MLEKVQRGLTYLKQRGPGEFARRASEKVRDGRFDYDRWVLSGRISPAKAGWQRNLVMKKMPEVCLLPFGRKDKADLRLTEDSLRRQTYARVRMTERLPRDMREDDLVVFAGAGDLLTEDAVFEIVSAIQEGALCVYTDSDRYRLVREEKRERLHYDSPRFLPDFEPEYLRAVPYIGPLFAVTRGLLMRAFPDSPEGEELNSRDFSDPAFFYDLLLRCSDAAGEKRIVHIPKVLCHCAGDLREELTERQLASMRQVLEKDLCRRKQQGLIEPGPAAGSFHVRYLTRGNPKVSIVIPNRDQVPVLRACLDSVFCKATWENTEIVIVENHSEKQETFDFYKSLTGDSSPYMGMPVRVIVSEEEGFNFSRLINQGVRAAEGDYVLLLNNDVTLKSADLIERLLSQVQREGVGAAGPRLLYPDGSIQSAGITVGLMGFAGSMMVRQDGKDPGYLCRGMTSHEMSAVTAACMMVRRDSFDKAGGFDERFAVALNDVDFCLKLGRAGLKVIYDPTAEAVHHESVSRGYETTPEKKKRFDREIALFRKKWAGFLKEGDPHYNPNLSRRKCDYSQQS